MAPSVFSARDLVNSHAVLDGMLPVKDLVEWFKQHTDTEFATVFQKGEIIGLVGREYLNARIAGNKYGFSVLADKPINKVVIENPMIVDASLPVNELVQQLLDRRLGSREFYNDIIVHDRGHYLGLASVKQLIVKQMEYILEQMRSLERQQMTLAQKNKELFEASMRINKSHSQFKSFFENCSIPIVVFDDYGRFLEGNPRFLRLVGYSAAQLAGQSNEVLFEGGISEMLTTMEKLHGDFGDRKPTYNLNLMKGNRQLQGVEVSYEYDEDTRHIIISILRQIDEEEMRKAKLFQTRAAEGGSSLFRSVAANLIDKEGSVNSAMLKMEAISSYAAKIESGNTVRYVPTSASQPIPSMASLTGQGAVNQNLNGSLGQLSIVDMTQLLVQGRKTGELTVVRDDNVTGILYIYQGLLCHAIMNNLTGKDALREIMRIDRGTFLFAYDVQAPEITIQGNDPMGILMDAVCEVDEEIGHQDDLVSAA